MYQGAFYIIILPVNLKYAKCKVEKTNSYNYETVAKWESNVVPDSEFIQFQKEKI